MVADWKPGKIGDEVSALDAGVSVNSDNDNKKIARYFVLKTSAVSKGNVDLQEIKAVVTRDISRLKCSLKANSILISRMNTPELVGECGFVAQNHDNIFLPDRIWQTTLAKESNLNCKWLAYLLNTNKYRSIVKNVATGTSNSMKNISKEQILNIELKYPHPTEQTTIAEALSDADSLIASLQKLITKKKAIKQGAMQELLTGKKRLPGFSGEWRRRPLGFTLTVGHGQSQKHIENATGIYPIMATGGCIGRTNEYLWDKPSVLIGRKGTINVPQYIESPFWTIDTLFYTKIHADFYPKFLYYNFCMIDWNKHNEASGVPSLSANIIEKVELVSPGCDEQGYKEQTAIAQVLSDMDAEIEQLDKKLSKYQQIKQGMMQELLTGRIRLIDKANTEQKQPAAKILSFTAASEQEQPASAKKHNQHFDDAVMIAAIVDAFYSDKYPLGRKKVQKLLYLMRRWEESDVSAFQKKAAGPYADSIRYKGGEPIATKSKYIFAEKNGKGTRFSRGENITQALGYIQTWEKQQSIDWLITNFQRTKVDDLELFATIDMATCDLRDLNQPVSVHTIKELINSTDEWRAKLAKTYFSDQDIQRAINKCREFFGGH